MANRQKHLSIAQWCFLSQKLLSCKIYPLRSLTRQCLWQLIYIIRFCPLRKIFLNKRAQKQTTRANVMEKLVNFPMYTRKFWVPWREKQGDIATFFLTDPPCFYSRNVKKLNCWNFLQFAVKNNFSTWRIRFDTLSIWSIATKTGTTPRAFVLVSIERVDHGV